MSELEGETDLTRATKDGLSSPNRRGVETAKFAGTTVKNAGIDGEPEKREKLAKP